MVFTKTLIWVGWRCLCRVGVAFSGRQSPGGHNIITGLHDALKNHNADSTLLGFIGTKISVLRDVYMSFDFPAFWKSLSIIEVLTRSCSTSRPPKSSVCWYSFARIKSSVSCLSTSWRLLTYDYVGYSCNSYRKQQKMLLKFRSFLGRAI